MADLANIRVGASGLCGQSANIGRFQLKRVGNLDGRVKARPACIFNPVSVHATMLGAVAYQGETAACAWRMFADVPLKKVA